MYVHNYMVINMYIRCMERKTRFIQLEFYTDYDTPGDYLAIVEVVADVPREVYTVRIPTPFTKFPRFPHIKN